MWNEHGIVREMNIEMYRTPPTISGDLVPRNSTSSDIPVSREGLTEHTAFQENLLNSDFMKDLWNYFTVILSILLNTNGDYDRYLNCVGSREIDIHVDVLGD